MTRYTRASAVIALLTALSSSGSGGGGVGRRPRSNGGVAAMAIDENSDVELTFFDQDFDHPPPPPSEEEGARGNKKKGGKQQQQQAEAEAEAEAAVSATNNTTTTHTNNNTLLYSHSIIGITPQNETILETPSPTPSPTPLTDHPLHNIPLPDFCQRLIQPPKHQTAASYEELPPWCQTWIDKNPSFVMPSVSPTWMPTSLEPTVGPSEMSGAPTPRFEVVRVEEVVSSVVTSTSVSSSVGNATGAANSIDNDAVALLLQEEDGNATNTNITTTNSTITTTTTTTTTTISITYQLTPMDDTFLEKGRSPLGSKTKLKIDASSEGVPTKVIMMKFGLGGVLDDLGQVLVPSLDAADNATANDNATNTTANNNTYTMENGQVLQNIQLTSTTATLQLYALTNTSSTGGYISLLSSTEEEEWTEEEVLWNDYVRGGRQDEKALGLLPGGGDGEDGGGVKMIGQVGGTGEDGGAIVGGEWYSAIVTEGVKEVLLGGDENNDGTDGDDNQLSLRITTDSSDGVIYASKEHGSGNGPVLELVFVLSGTTTTTTTTIATGGGGVASVESITTDEEEDDEDRLDELLLGGGNTTAEDAAVSLAVNGTETGNGTSTNSTLATNSSSTIESNTTTTELLVVVVGGSNTTVTASLTPAEAVLVDILDTPMPTPSPSKSPTPSPSNTPTMAPVEAVPVEVRPFKPSEVGDKTPIDDDLEEQDILSNNATILDSSTAPTNSTSTTADESIPVMARPFKPDQSDVEKTPIDVTDLEEDSTADIDSSMPNPEELIVAKEETETKEEELLESNTSTSVVSSSFRMTITAIKSIINRRNLLHHLRATPSEQYRQNNGHHRQLLDDYPSIEEKERPAITQHLTSVYEEVLSIAPVSISLVFEEDLVVEDINRGRNFEGVIRTSVFRVMAIFDDPDVSTIQSEDAARVLDQATIYAFFGPEEQEFINILKSTGDEPIVDEPAEYDVTVLKVNYSAGSGGGEQDGMQGAAATNMGNNANVNEGEETSSSSTASSWLEPTLIAGASVLVFASSAAAFILWRQRRGGEGLPGIGGAHHKKPGDNLDTPRSQETVPTTPSPNVFMDRFKNKKKFDYAEFEDDDIDVEQDYQHSIDSVCGAVISPLITTTNNNNNDFVTKPRNTNSRLSAVMNHQPTNDIKFSSQYPNISFDDSSVSDVSAHILGAKGTLKVVDANTTNADDPNASQAESFLLDTTMESYNMDAMSALDQLRFENVLQVDHYEGPPPYHHASATGEDDGSHSTGAVPSELYSNLSIDSSMLPNCSHDTSGVGAGAGTSSSASYGGHLFTSMDMMLRNKDSSLLDMPPPPSDAASDSSSRPDDDDDGMVEDDNFPADPTSLHPIIPASASGIENAPMRKKNEQDAVSQSINEELNKVMKLLGGPAAAKSQEENEDEEGMDETTEPGQSMDESVTHIGNVNEPAHLNDTPIVADGAPASSENGKVGEQNDQDPGLNVLIDDASTDAEPDEDDPLKLANNTLSDCINILEKARVHSKASSSLYANNDYGGVDAATEKEANEVEEEEDNSSMVTERLD